MHPPPSRYPTFPPTNQQPQKKHKNTKTQELPKSEGACWALLPGLEALQQAAGGYSLVAAAEAAAAGAAGAAGVTAGIEGLGLSGGAAQVCMSVCGCGGLGVHVCACVCCVCSRGGGAGRGRA